ncbi:MAG: nucleophile aminohydrolase [Olpidium bornovanus]|uniref:Amidophosphoribosyltransferase n=1 Tax=Olpidium bornovanus TaxID=278681 RepID=A0A8H8DKR8_9FUNG|nr:MAG: nucleophile aminohydrolase [Olpidium bornovanus]
MCGITALLLADQGSLAGPEIFEALGILQHRGQDAAGIVTCGSKGRLYQCKGNGMVRDVFGKDSLLNLLGHMGVGHGASGLFLNGNLTNSAELRNFLDFDAHRHINTDSDTELLLNIFADELQKTGKFRINEEDTFTALRNLYTKCRGGFACVAMIAGFGIIGFRDSNGIRPLIYGSRKSPEGTDYMFASESVALDVAGFKDPIDVKPGEAVIITKKSTLADAVVRQLGPNLDIDVVIPVPDTSRVSALQVATKLKILYREGFIKNRYIGRTFIMPGHAQAEAVCTEPFGAYVVPDSIVRGTTSCQIISMAREAGAKKVYFASCAPPVRYPNVYGIDMPTSRELVAYQRTNEEVANRIGADRVIYQDLADLVASCAKFSGEPEPHFDTSVFDGDYVTGDVSEEYLRELEALRSDESKSILGERDPIASETIGLYNAYGK